MDDGHTRIKTASDIFVSLYDHYFNWGGRIFVHIIDEVLLLMDERTTDLVNSIAFVVFTVVIYKIANLTNTIRPSLLLSISLSIFFFQPAFASTILWITGSANYLWGTLIIICLLYFYTKQAFMPKENNGIIKAILIFFLGILAGGCNENMAVGLIFMLIIFIVYYKTTTGSIPLWAISGLIGATIGAIFMIAAPGNYARMGAIVATEQSSGSIYIKQFLGAIAGYYYYVLIPTFIYLITLCLYLAYSNDKNRKAVLFTSTLYLVGAIVATLAMSASPIFPGRAAFGVISLVLVASAILFANLDFEKPLINRLIYITLTFGLLVFVADYYRGYQVLKEVDTHLQNRLEAINEGKRNGITDFILEDRISPESRLLHYYELTPDPTDWHNRMYSGYNEINSIIIK